MKSPTPADKEKLDKAIADAVRLGNIFRVEDLIDQYSCNPDASIAGHPLVTLAVKHKQPKMLALLLQKGAAVDAVNPDGDSALLLATRARKGDFVKLLLAAGAPLLQQNNAGDRSADIALRSTLASRREEDAAHQNRKHEFRAVIDKWGEVLEAFVTHPAFDATTGCDGKPYINFAVDASTPGVVSALLARGASIESITAAGDTPLLQAAQHCREDFTELLLGKGANVNAVNNAGEDAVSTLLKKAANMCAEEADLYDFQLKDHRPETARREALATLLINQQGFNAKGAAGGQPYIALAAAGTGIAVVEALLAKGANVDAQDSAGDTPLFKAARAGNQEMAEFLLQKGADARHINATGETLESIVLKGFADFVNTPLRTGHKQTRAKWEKFSAWAIEKDGYNIEAAAGGLTLLGLAARLDEPALVEALLKKGADINGQHDSGYTPLMAAVQGCRKEFAQALLSGGARLDITTKTGETVIGTALKGTSDFMDQMDNPPEHFDLREAPEQLARWESLFEMLAAGQGYDANAKGGGKPLVALAARFNSAATLKSLLEAGATPDAPADNGDTALMVATRHCHPDHAKLLLEKGASPYAQNAAGITAQKIAVDAEDAFLQTRPGSGTTWEQHEATRRKWDKLVDMLSSQQENVASALIAPPTEAVAVRNKPLRLKLKLGQQ
ncbi:MAG: ankyrin repeat domain-containing protein [Alphaproteobacteria bacterium]